MFFGKRFRKGFTLIEILIVVVILAILASMILPRMMGQIERGEAGEAFQWIGVLRRAAENTCAQTGSCDGYVYAQADNGYVGGDWGSLGLKDPGGLRKWGVYSYGFGSGYDSYVFDSSWENYIHFYRDESNAYWDCAGIFQPKTDASGNVTGCTI
jgi:prepilin-type N-terminal cleavage/methylation domain-containing protein